MTDLAQPGQAGVGITSEMERAGIFALDESYGVLAPHQIVAEVYKAMRSAQVLETEFHARPFEAK